MVGLLGKKLGMTEIFNEKGQFCPVTLIEAGPCFVNRVTKTPTTQVLELGFIKRTKKKKSQGEFVHFSSFPFSQKDQWQKGSELTVAVFKDAKLVNVSGLTKGRGFAGAVKRHNFSGGPKTHGHRHVLRSLGSVGMCSYPGEVVRGKKMPGHFGNEKATIQSLEVMRIEPDQNLLIIKGGIPGRNGGIVKIVSKEDVSGKEAKSTEKNQEQTEAVEKAPESQSQEETKQK